MKNSDIEAKMLSALLTGVNRAFPFAKGLKHVSTIFFSCSIKLFIVDVMAEKHLL